MKIRKKREKDAEIEHERKMDNTRNINLVWRGMKERTVRLNAIGRLVIKRQDCMLSKCNM